MSNKITATAFALINFGDEKEPFIEDVSVAVTEEDAIGEFVRTYKIDWEVLRAKYRIEKVSVSTGDEIQKYKIALADAVRRPMGVCPASSEGLITEKDLREAEARRTNKPVLETPCGECGQPVGSDYADYETFVVCGKCDCATQEGWDEFKGLHAKGEI